MQAEGILLGAQETVMSGDFLGEGRDEALAVDGDAKGGVDAVQQHGDVERGAGIFKYVMGHVNLGQTFLASGSRLGFVFLAEPSDGAQLGFESGFEYGQN